MKTTALVIPCRNEYARLRPEAFFDAIAQNPSLTFIFVDDGSTDRTDETLAFLERASAAIKALYLPRHQGKAEAVRTGVNWALAHTSADFIGFWDADLATPLSELSAFLAALATDASCWAAIGSRWPHLGARIGRSGGRGLAGAVMHTLIRTLARLPVYDTQCGAKLFRRDLAARVFVRPFISRWLFDVELLKRIPPGEATLVDGCEHGYCYEASRNDFYRSAAAVRDTVVPLVAPENRRKYRNQVRASHGVWPDMYWYARSSPGDRWSFDDPPEDRLSHWERNLFQAADAADECLWVFCSRSRLVDWKISHPRYGRALMAKKTLEERLPGAFGVVAAVRDPVAWARRRMAEMAAKGTLVDLTATGEAVSRQAWGHYVWELGNVRPGEYYAVCAEGRGGGAADVLWTRLGKPDEKTAAVPWLGHRRQTLETAADGMRRAMDVVRIPDTGASRLQVLLPGLSTNALPKVKFKPSRLAIHRLTFAD